MIIGVCTRHIGQQARTGADQFVLHAYRALYEYDVANRYLGYHEPLGRWAERHTVQPWLVSILSDLILKNVWVPVWARKTKLDLYLHLVPPICYTECRIPQICCIFDVPPKHERKDVWDRFFNYAFSRWSSRRASRVVTISDYSRQQIHTVYGVPLDRIVVVQPCTDLRLFSPSAALSGPTANRLRSAGCELGFVLGAMSRVTERKNPRAYVETYLRLPQDLRRRHKLVMVGACHAADTLAPFVDQNRMEEVLPDIVFLGSVSTLDLAGLYARCGALLFPSRFEGFGLPLIEAMACGAPVVASNIPAICEAIGGAVPLYAPDDWVGMADGLRKLFGDASTRALAIDACRKRAMGFSYRAFAERMAACMASVRKEWRDLDHRRAAR